MASAFSAIIPAIDELFVSLADLATDLSEQMDDLAQLAVIRTALHQGAMDETPHHL
ncbi:MAG: hypothetical protein WDN46_12510 [Methylocella sp.]